MVWGVGWLTFHVRSNVNVNSEDRHMPVIRGGSKLVQPTFLLSLLEIWVVQVIGHIIGGKRLKMDYHTLIFFLYHKKWLVEQWRVECLSLLYVEKYIFCIITCDIREFKMTEKSHFIKSPIANPGTLAMFVISNWCKHFCAFQCIMGQMTPPKMCVSLVKLLHEKRKSTDTIFSLTSSPHRVRWSIYNVKYWFNLLHRASSRAEKTFIPKNPPHIYPIHGGWPFFYILQNWQFQDLLSYI